ncbi:MAG: hypothetical protein ACLPPF_00615 [Rhodomicrobium sp.]
MLIVPSGPLTQLPFQVLIAPHAGGDNTSAARLIGARALTILPAVSAQKTLRRVVHAGATEKPMIGFGNPLLEGRQNDPKYGTDFKTLAALARQKERCPDAPAPTPMQRPACLLGLRGVSTVEIRGLANIAVLKAQAQLPETADELCAVARDLEANVSERRILTPIGKY